MKKSIVSLACAAALLPGVAAATDYLSSDTLTFAATASPYTVEFSWVDAVFTKTTKHASLTDELDGKYSWTLIDTNSNKVFAKDKNVADSISGDYAGVFSGSFSETFSSLTTGHKYKLLFIGDWNGGKDGEKWSMTGSPSVSLAAAVPEPETYAMLLAGFGLIGTMVRRRRSRS